MNAAHYYQTTNPTTRRSKYGAVKTTVDGIVFASKAEARRYSELRLLEKAGEIRGLRMQPAFALYVPHGHVQKRVGSYVADFEYQALTPKGWTYVIEDVKGVATALYRWKKKHFEAEYNMKISEIRYR